MRHFKTEDLKQEALAVIKKHKLLLTEEVVSYMSCSRKTYYDHGLHKDPDIMEAFDQYRISMKAGLRSKWYKSNNATVQIALYKLLATDDECDRLNGAKRIIEASTKMTEKAIQAYQLWLEKNPHVSEKDRVQAVKDIAKGVQIDPNALAKEIGVQYVEQVQ